MIIFLPVVIPFKKNHSKKDSINLQKVILFEGHREHVISIKNDTNGLHSRKDLAELMQMPFLTGQYFAAAYNLDVKIME